MSRTRTIQELQYIWNHYNNYTDLRSWSDEMARIASKGVEDGVITAREAHTLSHTGNI